jgi:hypothetical protein
MEIPKCANWREGKCERSDIVMSEARDGKSYILFCRTCKLLHVWSRSKVKAQARAQVQEKRRNEMSAREREQAKRAVKFYAPKQGWAR